MGKIQVIEIGVGAVVQKDGQVETLGSLVQVEKKTKSNARLKPMEKKSSQTAAASKQSQSRRKDG